MRIRDMCVNVMFCAAKNAKGTVFHHDGEKGFRGCSWMPLAANVSSVAAGFP